MCKPVSQRRLAKHVRTWRFNARLTTRPRERHVVVHTAPRSIVCSAQQVVGLYRWATRCHLANLYRYVQATHVGYRSVGCFNRSTRTVRLKIYKRTAEYYGHLTVFVMIMIVMIKLHSTFCGGKNSSSRCVLLEGQKVRWCSKVVIESTRK